MKILLVNPKSNIFSYNVPPMGILYLASSLKSKGFSQILIRDININETEKARNILKEIKPDILGISAIAFTYADALRITRMAKRIDPSVFTVFGGIHPTNAVENAIKDESCDCVVPGEGEITFSELCVALATNKDLAGVEGIVYKKDKTIFFSRPRKFIENLDQIQFPAYEFVDIGNYTVSPHHALFTRAKAGEIILPIIGSRGCFHSCVFCNRDIWGNRIRFRSPENIVSEIRYLIDNYSVRRFHFLDALFTADIEHTKKLCRLLIDSKLGISWFCATRLDLVDKPGLTLMKRAGCELVIYGTESGSQLVLDRLNKKISLAKMRENLLLTKSSGIKSYGNFIIGAPGETAKTANETIIFAKKYLDFASFSAALIFPKTGLSEIAQREGKKIFDDWDSFSLRDISKIAYTPEGMDFRSLKFYIRKAYFVFYSNPRIFLRILIRVFFSGKVVFFLKNITMAAKSITASLAYKTER